MAADGDGAGSPVTEKFTYEAIDGEIGNAGDLDISQWNAWADLDDVGNVTMRRLYQKAVDAVFARIDDLGNPAWDLTDNLGSVRDLIDNSANLLDHLDYTPFGQIAVETNPTNGDRYKYTAREWDAETQLQYNRARYYDPTTRRWISQDPLGFDAGDGNLYRYVRNEPVLFNDSAGLEAQATPFRQTPYGKRLVARLEKAKTILQERADRLLQLAKKLPNRDDVKEFRSLLEFIRRNAKKLQFRFSFVLQPEAQARPVDSKRFVVQINVFALVNLSSIKHKSVEDARPYRPENALVDLPLPQQPGFDLQTLTAIFGKQAAQWILKNARKNQVNLGNIAPPFFSEWNEKQLAALLANELFHMYKNGTVYRHLQIPRTAARWSSGVGILDWVASLSPLPDPNNPAKKRYRTYKDILVTQHLMQAVYYGRLFWEQPQK